MKPEDELRALVYAHYQAWKIPYEQRKVLLIEASRDHDCSSCGAVAYRGCWNKTDISRGKDSPRLNKLPHDERIDWEKAKMSLWRQGMWRESLVKLTLVRIAHQEEERKRGRQKGPQELPIQN